MSMTNCVHAKLNNISTDCGLVVSNLDLTQQQETIGLAWKAASIQINMWLLLIGRRIFKQQLWWVSLTLAEPVIHSNAMVPQHKQNKLK